MKVKIKEGIKSTTVKFPEGTTKEDVVKALEHIGGRPNDRK